MGDPSPPVDPFQTEVARVALSAAKDHGFALGGGHALIAHGIVQRPTEDIDLFTDRDDGVDDATTAVAQRLSDARLDAELIPETTELGASQHLGLSTHPVAQWRACLSLPTRTVHAANSC